MRPQRQGPGRALSAPVSERAWHAPEEAVELYLSDPEVAALARRLGWPTRAEDYLGRAGERAGPERETAPGLSPAVLR